MVADFVQACVGVGMFGDRVSCVLVKNRWLTCLEVLSLVCAGLMTHQCLPRAWARAFPKWDIPRNVGDSDSFHKVVQAKIYRSMLFLCHENSALKVLVTSVGIIYVDHLLQSLQKLDMESGMLLLLIGPDGPAVQCLVECTNMLLEPLCCWADSARRHLATALLGARSGSGAC